MNVDDSYLTSSCKGGIGGVFRDARESIILQFGKEVIVDMAVHVEVLAI